MASVSSNIHGQNEVAVSPPTTITDSGNATRARLTTSRAWGHSCTNMRLTPITSGVPRICSTVCAGDSPTRRMTPDGVSNSSAWSIASATASMTETSWPALDTTAVM